MHLSPRSVERYCGICYPLHSRVRGGRRLVVYLAPVLVFSLAFNLPKFLEITADMGVDWELAHNVLYNKIYKQYMELLVTVVLPWLILVYLNIRIYLAVTDKSLRSDFKRIKIKLKSSRFIPPHSPADGARPSATAGRRVSRSSSSPSSWSS